MSKSKRRERKNSMENSLIESSKVIELESAVSELTKNVSSMQKMMENMLVEKRDLENNLSIKQGTQGNSSSHPGNRSYISLWKDLGGNNIVFTPGGSTHPVDYMRKLTRALEDAEVPDNKKTDLAVNGLRGSAATWAAAKRGKFETFADFENAFMERYWDAECERKTFRKIQYGSFESGSRSDYFLKLVNENNYLSKPLTERELVDNLIKHFDHYVRRGIINNGIYEVDEIERFLRELDKIDDEDRNRYRNSNRNENINRGGTNNNHRNFNRNPQSNMNRDRNLGGNVNRVEDRENLRNDRQNTGVQNNDPTLCLINSSREEIALITPEEMLGTDEINKKIPNFNNDIETDLLSETEFEQSVSPKMQWPLLTVSIGGERINALIDSGSQYNCLSQELFEKIKSENDKMPIFPVTGLCIKGAVGSKS